MHRLISRLISSNSGDLLDNLDDFLRWHGEAGKVRIFWAKPIHSLKIIQNIGEAYVIQVIWRTKSRNRDATLIISPKKLENNYLTVLAS